MKKRDFIMYQEKPIDELARVLHERRVRLHDLQEDLVSGKIKSLKEMHMIQRDIAQLCTLLESKK